MSLIGWQFLGITSIRKGAGMSERKQGAFAAGDPSLIPRLTAGGSTTLHTANALLGCMDEPPIGPRFTGEVEAFLSETGIGERQFGSRAAGDPSHS